MHKHILTLKHTHTNPHTYTVLTNLKFLLPASESYKKLAKSQNDLRKIEGLRGLYKKQKLISSGMFFDLNNLLLLGKIGVKSGKIRSISAVYTSTKA